MPGSEPRRVRRAPLLWMGAAAAAMLAMLLRAHLAGDYDPASRQYGYNFPGDLRHYGTMGAVELLVLTAVLRPWSYRHAPGRALLALVLWIPWMMLAAVSCMHCGPIGGALVLWRMAMAVALFATIIVSAVGRRRARRAAPRG